MSLIASSASSLADAAQLTRDIGRKERERFVYLFVFLFSFSEPGSAPYPIPPGGIGGDSVRVSVAFSIRLWKSGKGAPSVGYRDDGALGVWSNRMLGGIYSVLSPAFA
jgi:hypothetical protein